MDLPKLLESTARIRFQDCDPFNHLNNGKYLDYFINAREDQIEHHYGLNIYKFAQENGSGWVSSSNQLAYFRPADTMETVVIQSQLFKYSAKHLLVEARMYDIQKQHLKAFCWMGFIHINLKTMRSHEHSEALMQLFQQVNLPVPENEFSKREFYFRSIKSSYTV